MMPLTDSIGGEKLETKQDPGRTLLEGDVTSIITTLEQLFHPRPHQEQQDRLTQTLSVMFRENQVSIDTAQEVIGTFKLNHETSNRVYNHELTSDEEAETPSLNTLLKTFGVPAETARNINRTLNKIVSPPKYYGQMYGSLGTNKMLIIDPNTKQTLIENTREINGKDYSKNEIILDAIPTKLIVYDNPVAQETRQFKSTWESTLSNRPITLGPETAGEIAAMLSESSYSISKNKTEDTVKAAFNLMIKTGMAELKTEIDTPGFYYNEEKGTISPIKYKLPTATLKEDLIKGLETLTEFAGYFNKKETAVATIFKWGLISPFIFAIKQMGGWVKWPYLYGNGGTGKSTLGKMVLYIWNEPDNDTNNVSGGGFNNDARIGDRLKQFTFPIIVDEPGAVFEKIGTSEMIKTAVEHTVSRGKYVGRRYRTIPAYASVVFTANQKYPDDDAYDRRFYTILFPRSERKTKEEREEFDRVFRMNNTRTCKLHDLKSIGHFIATEIIADPKLLELDWQELIDTLLVRLCSDIGITTPEWLLKWSPVETMADLDDIHTEDIRGFLQEQINMAYGQIQVMDEDGKPKSRYDGQAEVKGTDDFIHRVWVVLNERKIPWLLQGSDNTVYITHGFVRALKKRECVNESLPSIADLLGWKYAKGNIKSAGFSGAHIRVNRTRFTEFVFPSCTARGDKCDEL